MKKQLSKQITVGIDPYSGKRIRKRIYAASEPGLKQAEKEMIRQYAKDGVSSHMTYDQYENKWWEAYATILTPSTQKSYKTYLRKNTEFRHKQMQKIIRLDLQKVINANCTHPELCKTYVFLMRSIWKSAMFDGIVSKDITEGLKIPKRQKVDRRPLREEELEAIKTAKFEPQERFLVNLLMQFGMRPGEALALNKSAFNRKDKTLTINKALAHNGEEPFIKTTKTGVTRVLPVPDSFWSLIPETKTMYFFTNEADQLLRRDQMNRMKRRILKKINEAMGGTSKLWMTDITLYNFRHHKASLLYYLPGVSFKKKAEYMGHTEETFLKTYSHMMEEMEDVEILRQSVM